MYATGITCTHRQSTKDIQLQQRIWNYENKILLLDLSQNVARNLTH